MKKLFLIGSGGSSEHFHSQGKDTLLPLPHGADTNGLPRQQLASFVPPSINN
jgi:hypothetical protein